MCHCYSFPGRCGASRASGQARLSTEDSAAYTVLNVAAGSLHPEPSRQVTPSALHGVGLGWSCLDASKDLKTDCIGLHGLARCGSVGSGWGWAVWERRQGRGKADDRIARDGRGGSAWMGHGKLALSGRLEGLRKRWIGAGWLACLLVCYIVLMHSAGAACSSIDSAMASASQKSMCFLAFLYFMALIIQKK